MSNSSSISSDEERSLNALISHNTSNSLSGHLETSSSDSEDLEVVESGGTPQSVTYERANSQGEESPYQISNFYYQTNDYKSEPEEPTYSLDVPSKDDSFQNSSENNFFKKSSGKKKKEKSSKRSNESLKPVNSNKKSSKRKHNCEDSNFKQRKKSRYDSKEKYSGFSSITEHSGDVSENSHVSYYESGHGSLGYTPQNVVSSPEPLPDLLEQEEDILRFRSYGINKDIRKSKKDSERHKEERADLKTKIGSSNKGRLLMQKMGYVDGAGLGKHADGRTEPVELSKQKGRRGLGLSLPGLDNNQSVEWDPNLEEIHLHEPVQWLDNSGCEILDFETMIDSWLTEGPKNLDISSMNEFINEEILANILQKKSVFDHLSDNELQSVIAKSNPFETIRKSIFMNRAAVKMANIDSAFDFMFTEPKVKGKQEPLIHENELLYFADVCAGPGGFSEYVFWKKKWRAKGIGFTLKGDCDFKIQDFNSGPSETFEPYYGVKGDGNIYDPDNIVSLEDFVMRVTDNKGVHFMMADGGFSVKGQENIQELLSKQLYLCQFLVALSIVREDGHFVCKLFDIFSPFSAGLIYLMHHSFDRICIFKPNSSRPANSERYIICKYRKKNIGDIRQYLFEINKRMWKLGSASEVDINECVPIAIMKDNIEFYNYLLDSNNTLGNKQVVCLDKVIAYFKDPTLHELKQSYFRKQSVELWKIPLGPRRDEHHDTEVARNIMKLAMTEKNDHESEIWNTKGKKLVPENLKEIFDISILDWECVPLGAEKLIFLLGLGKGKVYEWVGSKWSYYDKAKIELPPGTLLYGEYVPEYEGKAMGQKKITAFHIVDAISVGYEIISNHTYSKRIRILNLFVAALKKYNTTTLCPIRVKSPREMKDIIQISKSVGHVMMKSGSYETCLPITEYNHYLQMKGICFIRTTKDPWRKHLSKKTNHYYYYNGMTKESLFENERPRDSIATAIYSLKKQVLWIWEEGVGYKGEDRKPKVLHKDELLSFIREKSSI